MKNLTFLLLFSSIVFGQDDTLKEVEIYIRSNDKIQITQKTIGLKTIDNNFFSQEVPSFLSSSPGITFSSDGGHNQGYMSFRLRGMDQTRINMTLDGIPLNEPEDQGVYFSNFPDFLNSVKSVQIQRGVGTSSYGTSSYAGSISFESNIATKNYTEINFGYGSFNSHKTSVENNVKNKNSNIYTRFSYFNSDGYKYNSGNKGYSFFMTGSWYNEKNIIKLTTFTGRSFNQMSWFAVNELDINIDPKTNYNTEREDDDFMQSMFILRHTNFINKNNSISTAIFYNRLDGNWKLDLLPLSGDDLVLNYLLSSNFYGLTSNYKFKLNKFNSNFGISFNSYQRNHKMNTILDPSIIYSNTGTKNELSSFLKLNYEFKNISLFSDLQLRYVLFDYLGSMQMEQLDWIFFNPKAGINYSNKDLILYYSIGQSHREPTRTDIFAGQDDPTSYLNINSESVVDHELGFKLKKNYINLESNIYYMDFNNEITLLGALGNNGLPLMTNVKNSFRSGLEIDLELKILEKKKTNINLLGNIAYSYNRIYEESRIFQPLYSPNLIINQQLNMSYNKITLSFDMKYHSKSYINWDNTLETPAFSIFGAQLYYKIFKQTSISLRVNNIFDKKYFTNGYAIDNQRYFFVNSGTNYFFQIKTCF